MIKEFKTLYPVKIYIGINITEEEVESIVDYKKGFIDIPQQLDICGQTYYFYHKRTENDTTTDESVCVNINIDIDTERQLIQTIAHESLHATNMIYKIIGEENTSTTNDEPFAFLLEEIVGFCYDTVNEYKLNNK